MAQGRVTSPYHGAVHGVQWARQDRGRQQCESERPSDVAGPGAIQDAEAAAMEGGVTMDEIVSCVRARGGDGSDSAAGRHTEAIDGPMCMRRAAH